MRFLAVFLPANATTNLLARAKSCPGMWMESLAQCGDYSTRTRARVKIEPASFSVREFRAEKLRLSRRGKRICPPALYLSGALSVVSDVSRCRSWTRWDVPAQSNADRRIRGTARERTSYQPRSHESTGCQNPAVRRVVRPTACRVGDVSGEDHSALLFLPNDESRTDLSRELSAPRTSKKRENHRNDRVVETTTKNVGGIN